MGTRVGVNSNVLSGAKRRPHIGLEGTLMYDPVGSAPKAVLKNVAIFQKKLSVAESTCPHFVLKSPLSMPNQVCDQRNLLASRSLDLP
jgi:hypothetical protein